MCILSCLWACVKDVMGMCENVYDDSQHGRIVMDFISLINHKYFNNKMITLICGDDVNEILILV